MHVETMCDVRSVHWLRWNRTGLWQCKLSNLNKHYTAHGEIQLMLEA